MKSYKWILNGMVSDQSPTSQEQAYEREHRHSMDVYEELQKLGVRNQELRRLMPVGWSTAAFVYVNARSLRHFFELRLEKSAEWEIRRLAYLMFNDVMAIAPTLFEDLIKEEVSSTYK